MPTSETFPIPVALGRFALFLPFLVVIAVLFATGRHSASDLALSLPFIAIPIAIFLLRRRAMERPMHR
jgi:hypothetical protein